MRSKLTKITLAASIMFAMAFTLSCSDSNKDDSPSVIFACNHASIGYCWEVTKFKNDASKREAKEFCEDEYWEGTIVSECNRNGVKLECPDKEDGDEGIDFIYNGLVWEIGGSDGTDMKCRDLDDVLGYLDSFRE